MEINKLIAHSSNFTKGRKQKIQFLVIHYTANNGDLAKVIVTILNYLIKMHLLIIL